MTRIAEHRLTRRHAGALLGLSERQVRRLYQAFTRDGAAALASGRRGRPSNRRLADTTRERALALVRERYADFGPTFAHQKLTEDHALVLSVETLRGWMLAAGLWVSRAQRTRRSQPPRPRRTCLGELVQLDGSDHAWFEAREPKALSLSVTAGKRQATLVGVSAEGRRRGAIRVSRCTPGSKHGLEPPVVDRHAGAWLGKGIARGEGLQPLARLPQPHVAHVPPGDVQRDRLALVNLDPVRGLLARLEALLHLAARLQAQRGGVDLRVRCHRERDVPLALGLRAQAQLVRPRIRQQVQLSSSAPPCRTARTARGRDRRSRMPSPRGSGP